MDSITMTWLSFIVILLAIQGGAILLGYWMGRNSERLPFSETPKQFDPGPPGVEIDPYAEALKGDQEKRIETV